MELDRWERRLDGVIRYVPYAALAVSTVLAWATAPVLPGPPLPGTFAVAGLAAAWMLWMVTVHPSWQSRPGLMTVYFVVLIGLIAVLVVRSPLFGFFAFTGYLHAVYALRGRWRIVGVA